jgi:hypothetical protein
MCISLSFENSPENGHLKLSSAPGEASIPSTLSPSGITHCSVCRASPCFLVAKPSMFRFSDRHCAAVQSEAVEGFGHSVEDGHSSQWMIEHHAMGIARM